jgi:hypothetical protein
MRPSSTLTLVKSKSELALKKHSILEIVEPASPSPSPSSSSSSSVLYQTSDSNDRQKIACSLLRSLNDKALLANDTEDNEALTAGEVSSLINLHSNASSTLSLINNNNNKAQNDELSLELRRSKSCRHFVKKSSRNNKKSIIKSSTNPRILIKDKRHSMITDESLSFQNQNYIENHFFLHTPCPSFIDVEFDEETNDRLKQDLSLFHENYIKKFYESVPTNVLGDDLDSWDYDSVKLIPNQSLLKPLQKSKSFSLNSSNQVRANLKSSNVLSNNNNQNYARFRTLKDPCSYLSHYKAEKFAKYLHANSYMTLNRPEIAQSPPELSSRSHYNLIQPISTPPNIEIKRENSFMDELNKQQQNKPCTTNIGFKIDATSSNNKNTILPNQKCIPYITQAMNRAGGGTLRITPQTYNQIANTRSKKSSNAANNKNNLTKSLLNRIMSSNSGMKQRPSVTRNFHDPSHDDEYSLYNILNIDSAQQQNQQHISSSISETELNSVMFSAKSNRRTPLPNKLPIKSSNNQRRVIELYDRSSAIQQNYELLNNLTNSSSAKSRALELLNGNSLNANGARKMSSNLQRTFSSPKLQQILKPSLLTNQQQARSNNNNNSYKNLTNFNVTNSQTGSPLITPLASINNISKKNVNNHFYYNRSNLNSANRRFINMINQTLKSNV